MIREEWLKIKQASIRDIRKFGWLVGGVSLGISGILWWKHGELTLISLIVGAMGVGLIIGGTLVPAWLRPVYRLWMGIAIVLGSLMTQVILTLVFIGVVTPIGWLKRWFTRPQEPHKSSYWIPCESTEDKARYEHMY